MGALAGIGQGIGQAFAPSAAAAVGAKSALGWGTLATGMQVGADVLQGVGGFQQAQYAAKLAGRNAGVARLAGQVEESASKGRTTAAVAGAKASQAANGVEVNSGTAVNVRNAVQAFGDMDAAMIHYNAAKAAYGLEAEAAVDKAAGRAALAGGALKAGASFLSGANSLSDKWQSYRRSGAA